ncbi:hypothetical protein NVP1029O_16 [Vibrio phage 1.029.O._10N.261.55.A7]|nr:hypothetical protein NVP1029O_16 [Vibrio phage 1.029.O._10N.261.55.A7]
MSDQIVQIVIYKESGCDIREEEYSVTLIGMMGSIIFNENGGESDYHLIKTAVEEWVSSEVENIDHGIDQEYEITLIMSERYELQDVFSVKWFEVDSFKFTDNL